MPPPTAFFARLAGVTLLYVATAKAGLLLAVVGHTVTLVWAPSGIALAALLAYGYRMAFGVAIGAFVANAAGELPLAAAAGIAVGNTIEALVGAFLLMRLAGFRNALDRRRDVFALIVLAAVGATMLSAFMGVATLSMGNIITESDYATVWLKWWLGDMMGVLVVAPPFLVWLSRARPHLSPSKAFEACCLAVVLTAVSLNIFGAPQLAVQGFYPASLAVFPFIIWGALRFDQWGASLVTLIVSLLAVWCTTHGTGPFVVAEPVDSLVRWCAFAIVLAVTGLLLAASVAEQRRTQAELKSSHDQLEQRVFERTQDLAQTNVDLLKEMTERRRLEASLIRVSEEQQQNMGRELHDGLGQQLTSLALFSATLQHRLEEQAQPEAELAGRIVEQVHQATAMVRSVAHGLYPAELEFDGLPAALARLAEDTLSLQGLHCTFQADADVQVGDALVAINLYRIAQEAVHNAVKYSQASELRITLTQGQGRHQLVVSDNGIGIGINLASSQQSRGMGMHSMRYRASLLGGHFEIATNTPSGTTIRVTYPDQKVQSEQQHGA